MNKYVATISLELDCISLIVVPNGEKTMILFIWKNWEEKNEGYNNEQCNNEDCGNEKFIWQCNDEACSYKK